MVEDMQGREIEESNDPLAAEIRDTDIVFDCPHCGKNLVIDYRGAGLQINCSDCGEQVLVPILYRLFFQPIFKLYHYIGFNAFVMYADTLG